MSKTDETRRVIETMVDGLNDHRIDDIGEFFPKGFVGWEIRDKPAQNGPTGISGQLATSVSGRLFREGL